MGSDVEGGGGGGSVKIFKYSAGIYLDRRGKVTKHHAL
jgi:hypothetical protein